MIKISILGETGRMGNLLVKELEASDNYQFHPLTSGLSEVAVVIDFSSPQFLLEHLDKFVQNKVAVISGTTGFSENEFKIVEAAAKEIPILYSRNFSIGVYILSQLVRESEQYLKGKCEVEIVEMHHREKKDAPSGTALQLGEIIANERQKRLTDIARYGRSGDNRRKENEICFHSLRGGKIVGEHSVQFILNNEVIELRHEALDRKVFAEGAISCIPFIRKQTKGLFSLNDVYNKE